MKNLEFRNINAIDFEATALEVFRFQYDNVAIYREFCDSLKRTPNRVNRLAELPFLPVSFFKTHVVAGSGTICEKIFESSTTGGGVPSRHFVASLRVYENSFLNAFERFYGKADQYGFLALLPSYMERGTSSLLYMAERLIRDSRCSASGFFNNDFEKLQVSLQAVRAEGKQPFLLGVTYALLDFAESHPQDLSDCVVMETGGMKGRRIELTRAEVHHTLKTAFNISSVHSEYGMTELLSQAYSKGDGIFESPPWMRLLVRDPGDPLTLLGDGKTGALNVIDLANIHSCSFLATSDAGIVNGATFEVMGRLDHSDVRGCNLMYQ